MGLTFSAPPEMIVTGEKLDDDTFTLYVQKSEYPDQEYYQLYGLYNLAAEHMNVEGLKQGLIVDSVTESTVSGFPATSGQNLGERGRLITYISTNRGLFTIATAQPTPENGAVTASILATFQLE